MDQLLSDGKFPISQQKLNELVAGKTFHLEAIDFDARVHFLTDGNLTGINLQGKKEKGKWNTTPEDQLCIKYDSWYFGDLKCYKIFQENTNLLFFTSNGARYYTGKMLTGSKSLAGSIASSNRDQKGQAPSSGTNSISKGKSPRSPIRTDKEKQHTLFNLARNCPGCDLSGVVLKGAQLIAANLTGANLSGSDLSEANLRRASLAGANLSGAKLVRTNLAGADLSGSDLSGADLTGSNLIRAIVTDANLDGAILNSAHLESIQGMKY